MSQAIVAEEKAKLEAAGEDITGPCGAFKIVRNVAHRLASEQPQEQWGYLGGKTPAQNGCTVGSDRYSVDWILKPNGMGRDILGDAGNANNPQWGHEEAADATLYRPVSAVPPVPVDGGTPEPPDPPDPPPTDPDLADLQRQVNLLTLQVRTLSDDLVELDARVTTLEQAPPPVPHLPPLPDYFGIGKVFGIGIPVTSKPTTSWP